MPSACNAYVAIIILLRTSFSYLKHVRHNFFLLFFLLSRSLHIFIVNYLHFRIHDISWSTFSMRCGTHANPSSVVFMHWTVNAWNMMMTFGRMGASIASHRHFHFFTREIYICCSINCVVDDVTNRVYLLAFSPKFHEWIRFGRTLRNQRKCNLIIIFYASEVPITAFDTNKIHTRSMAVDTRIYRYDISWELKTATSKTRN